MTNALLLTSSLLSLVTQAAETTAVLQRAQQEGRDVLDAELDEAIRKISLARANLQAGIDQAKTAALSGTSASPRT